jgi:hypothetical protein
MGIKTIAAALLVAANAPAAAIQADRTATAQPRAPQIVREAEAFMAAYALELAAGNRAALGARYDRRGAYLQGFAGDVYSDQPAIAAFYAGPEWAPPRAFAWQNLRYEPVGPGAVLVVGRFLWTPATGAPLTASYTALLVRDGRVLRIRMEHESAVAPPASQGN